MATLDAQKLIRWYRGVRRELPWRKDRDPYRIWISEVMLQQTTVAAVVPYYKKFLARFPTLASLSKAKLEDVLEHWAGLGYYSRARNLHRAAQALARLPNGFPRTHVDLMELPGFGPYTSRAVASLAFGEKTGVLDGNAIRVLCRRHALRNEWWKPEPRARLQEIADRLASEAVCAADLNQALMELGATVCTPQAPACLLCPWSKVCKARETNIVIDLPLKRPRREREIWEWKPQVIEKSGKVLLVKNSYAPFLRGHWILPGRVQRLTTNPKKFDYKGTVTHHDIFVSVARKKASPARSAAGERKWVPLMSLRREVPASLIRKAIDVAVRTPGSRNKLSTVLLLSVALFVSSSCQAGAKKPSPTPGAILPTPTPLPAAAPMAPIRAGGLKLQPLTAVGTNSQARFSPDGSRLVFISAARPAHKGAQVYEYDFADRRERRMTYHAGDDGAPVYSTDGQKILYTSNTDEIKDEKIAVDHLMRVYLPGGAKNPSDPSGDLGDLYLQSRNGRDIERLTQDPGYQGDGDFDPQGKHIVYVSRSPSGDYDLDLRNVRSHGVTKIVGGNDAKRTPRFSPDGNRIAWAQAPATASNPPLRVGAFTDTWRIYVAKKPFTAGRPAAKPFFPDNDTQVDPAWQPQGDGFVFSSSRGGKFLNLYWADDNGVCIKRLSQADFDETQPSFSPDGKKLVFTATLKPGDPTQIYEAAFNPPKDCTFKNPVPVAELQPTASPPKKPAPTSGPKPDPTPAPAASTPK